MIIIMKIITIIIIIIIIIIIMKIITIIIIIIIMTISFQKTTNVGMIEEDEHPIPTKYPIQTSRRGQKADISSALKPVLETG